MKIKFKQVWNMLPYKAFTVKQGKMPGAYICTLIFAQTMVI